MIPAATEGSPVNVYVGGNTATQEDMAAKIAERLPVFIGAVVILSVLLLMAVFRSVWVPLVSAAFNLLDRRCLRRGRGDLPVAVGIESCSIDGELPIVSFIPLLMFAILFGLSMTTTSFSSRASARST